MARTRFAQVFTDYCRSFWRRMRTCSQSRAGGDRSDFHADSVQDDITRGWQELARSVPRVEVWKGGTHAALERLKMFKSKLLADYDRQRNHPEVDGTSALSPYLHFGHLGPLTIALAVDAAAKADPSLQAARDAYFNELVVWRELAGNFGPYTPKDDSGGGAGNRAKQSIAEHRAVGTGGVY